MTRAEAERTVREELAAIAPESTSVQLDPTLPLRDQVELDSYDFLQLVVRLHERTGVEIAEADYPRLRTLDGLTSHLTSAG